MRRVLPIFSYILHPVLIPLFATVLYFLLAPHYLTPWQQILVYIQVSILTFFIPISFFFLLRSLGRADSLMVAKVSQRRLPLLIQSVLLLILITKSITIDKIPELYFFFLAALASTLAALAFSLLRVKVSLHMLGISSLAVFAVVISLLHHVNGVFHVAVLVLLIGITASSRLEMKAHSGTELVLGFICGLLPQMAIGYVYLYL